MGGEGIVDIFSRSQNFGDMLEMTGNIHEKRLRQEIKIPSKYRVLNITGSRDSECKEFIEFFFTVDILLGSNSKRN